MYDYMYIHVYIHVYMYMYCIYMYIPLANIQRGILSSKNSITFNRSLFRLFCHFHVETNYYHFECFATLVTHSQGHRGQMSQIHMYMKVISVLEGLMIALPGYQISLTS